MLGAIIFAVCVISALLLLLWSAKAKTIAQAPATAILNIIEAPTETPPLPMATATSTPEPTSSQQLPTPGGEIRLGDYVQVSGTGGDGLRLHAAAGVTSEVRYLAIDSEVFVVKEGPIDADGYVWWLLEDPYTEGSVGWGVANYLAVMKNP